MKIHFQLEGEEKYIDNFMFAKAIYDECIHSNEVGSTSLNARIIAQMLLLQADVDESSKLEKRLNGECAGIVLY